MYEDSPDRDDGPRPPTGLEVETVALLASHGMPVTEEGKARARTLLASADARMTPERWQALRELLGRYGSAA